MSSHAPYFFENSPTIHFWSYPLWITQVFIMLKNVLWLKLWAHLIFMTILNIYNLHITILAGTRVISLRLKIMRYDDTTRYLIISSDWVQTYFSGTKHWRIKPVLTLTLMAWIMTFLKKIWDGVHFTKCCAKNYFVSLLRQYQTYVILTG